jgi:Helix-turn-helix domain
MAAARRPAAARLARAERRRRARQLRERGLTLRQIAAQLGASASTISTDLGSPSPPQAGPAVLSGEPLQPRPPARVPTPGRPPLELVRAALRQLSR